MSTRTEHECMSSGPVGGLLQVPEGREGGDTRRACDWSVDGDFEKPVHGVGAVGSMALAPGADCHPPHHLDHHHYWPGVT